MKKYIVLLLLITTHYFSDAQTNCNDDLQPISIQDIKTGLGDFSKLRATLLENGFRLSPNQDSKSNEQWEVPTRNNNLGHCISLLLISEENEISFALVPDNTPKYIQKFKELIKSYFPEKRAVKTQEFFGNSTTPKEVYIIEYSKPGINLIAQIDENDSSIESIEFFLR